MSSGKLLIIEGPDGAGKSTQAARLGARLRQAGVDLLTPREPGGTAAGEAIRELLLSAKKKALSPTSEMFLFQAARAQLVAEVLRPALKKGQWVLCDRFTLSTQIYQGRAGGVDEAGVEAASALATGGLRPDLYLVLWAPLSVCRARCDARGGKVKDRMESKGRAFQETVSNAYRELAQRGRPYVLVDAAGTEAEIEAAIVRHVAKLLPVGKRKKFLIN